MRTQREVRSLTADEERRLRAHIEGNALRAEQTHAWHPVRAQAIIETFLGSGLRISELAALTCGDLLLGRGESALIVRRGKGGKRRVVGIRPALKRRLRVFLDAKAAKGEAVAPTAPLFASERGGRRLHRSAVWRVVKGAFAAVGVRAVPYALRHTHARRLLASGADLAEVQAQLGHASLATTGIYVKPTLEERVAAVARMEESRESPANSSRKLAVFRSGTQPKRPNVADRLAKDRRTPGRNVRTVANSD